MYLRVATLIELAAEVVGLPSRQTLAERLGIALPTLNAYRGGQRFPESGDESLFRKHTQELLLEAIQQVGPRKEFDCEAYTLSTLRLGKRFRRLNRTFGVQGMGYIASRVAVKLFVRREAKEYPASKALLQLIGQQATPAALESIVGWIFTKYVKCMDSFEKAAHSAEAPFPVVIENIPDFVRNFREKEQQGIELHVPMPWAWDIILLVADGFSYTTDIADAPENEVRPVSSQFELKYMGQVLKPPRQILSWHRRQR